LEKALTTETPISSTTWSFIRPQGDKGLLEVSVSLTRDSSGAANGFCGICRDVTERKRSEDLMLRSARLEAVAELATGVAHNFNNLLQIIMTASHLATSSIESGNVKQAVDSLKIVNESSASGADTVKRLQEFANVRADGRSKSFEVFDLSNTVIHALEMSRSICLPRSGESAPLVTITSELEEGCNILGNQSEIFQVIINLVKNAVESIDGSGEVVARTYGVDDAVILEVTDTGVGIPDHFQSKIFEPFWTTKGGHGTGLGLAGSYGIIQRHNGNISFESRDQGGAIFRVTIPKAHKAATVEPLDQASISDSAKYSILLVDDTPMVLEQLKEGIEAMGHEVTASKTGEDALEKLSQSIPDAVVCDLGLPGIDGWQVGRRFKELCSQKGTDKPPFIILTGWAGQIEAEEKSAQCGVDRIMEKPARVRALLNAINELSHSDPAHQTS
jgi:signal transduction histidine kinase/ActR/RegA family two-component response regulator